MQVRRLQSLLYPAVKINFGRTQNNPKNLKRKISEIHQHAVTQLRERRSMINRKNIWLVGLVMCLALGISLRAQGYGGRWAYLGDAHVDGAQDHDVIHVGIHDGRFRAVQLRVSGGAVEFQRVVVHFGNGTQEELMVHERIPSGGRTRPMDLPGERRVIESVELWYSKASWHRRPRVTLFGIR
jgi:hypothetical protein